MTVNLAEIARVAAGEAIKQQTDLSGLARLLDAYRWAYQTRDAADIIVWLTEIARRVERCNIQGYRHVPVTFRDMGYACPADLIPASMARWVRDLGDFPSPDHAVKELLTIHPWLDGNGRVAWIVRTRLTNTWGAPEPLPDYFGS